MDVQKFRHDYNLNQKDLADIIGCKQSNVSLIEKGERNFTNFQIRLLIEKFGFDVISKYADPGELPQGITVNAPVISGNSGPVQSGSGNQMSTAGDTASLIALMNKMLDENAKQMATKDAQIDRLIKILEDKR